MVTFEPDLTAQIARDLGVHKEALRTRTDDPGVESPVAARAAGAVGLGRGAPGENPGQRAFRSLRGQVGPYITAPPVFEHFTPPTDSPIRVNADRAGQRRLRTGR
jgi:hypothetical protein